jgi:hypothetical protein
LTTTPLCCEDVFPIIDIDRRSWCDVAAPINGLHICTETGGNTHGELKKGNQDTQYCSSRPDFSNSDCLPGCPPKCETRAPISAFGIAKHTSLRDWSGRACHVNIMTLLLWCDCRRETRKMFFSKLPGVCEVLREHGHRSGD